jgi:menaquinone-dependent protoporphyrinogen IX oxidase
MANIEQSISESSPLTWLPADTEPALVEVYRPARTLIVYYSRTGTTRRVADALAYALTAPQSPDVEVLTDTKHRQGPIGFLRAVTDAVGRKVIPIEPVNCHPADYDLVIVGTPVWADTMCSAVRTYLHKYGQAIRKAALFCTTAGSGIDDTHAAMAELIAGEIIAKAGFRAKFVKNDEHIGLMDEFLDHIRETVDA